MRKLWLVVVALGIWGCAKTEATRPANPVDKHDEELKGMFKTARQFLTAIKAGDAETAVSLAELPCIVGDEMKFQKIEAKDELLAKLKKVREECGGPDEIAAPVLMRPIRLEDAHGKSERDLWEHWLKVTGKDSYVITTGEPIKPARVKLLMHLKGGKASVVGVLY